MSSDANIVIKKWIDVFPFLLPKVQVKIQQSSLKREYIHYSEKVGVEGWIFEQMRVFRKFLWKLKSEPDHTER